MICKSCQIAADQNRQNMHCKDPRWCDCQHKPPTKLKEVDATRQESSET